MIAVDRATSMIVSCARPNASAAFPAAFDTRPDVGSVPATGIASTSISTPPTRTGIKRLPPTTTNPQETRKRTAVRWQNLSLPARTVTESLQATSNRTASD